MELKSLEAEVKGLRSANLEFLERQKALEARLEETTRQLTVLVNQVLELSLRQPMERRMVRGQDVVARLNREALEAAINERSSG